MSKNEHKHAAFLGIWPFAEAHNPALDEVEIPVGASVYGLFDENYAKYNAPDSVPGLMIVSSLAEIKQDCYCVINTMCVLIMVRLLAIQAKRLHKVLKD